jgi:hypothetical protein
MSFTGKIKTLFSDKARIEPLFPRTKVRAVSDDNNVGLNVLLENLKADINTVSAGSIKYNIQTVTLSSSAWASNTQTISAAGVTVDNDIDVFAAPISHQAYCKAGVYCSAQADGKLTFTCSATPTENLVVNIRIWN